MKQIICLLILLLWGFTACGRTDRPAETATTAATEILTTAASEPAQPEHSAYYIPGLDEESLITYFNEVVLDAEFTDGGDASLVQKWDQKILYSVTGQPTGKDLSVLEKMVQWLNQIPGFPGMAPVEPGEFANLQIHFTDEQGMVARLGEEYRGLDGAVRFWYDGENRIYEGVICLRTDLDQKTRNSVIQEEIYNGMGPVQDTDLRQDSLIWSGFSTPQDMTDVDRLIMTLLYHPGIRCGMNREDCQRVIRELYD